MKLYKAFGEKKPWREWAKDYRTKVKNNRNFRNRLKEGFTIEEALITPVKNRLKVEDSIKKKYDYLKINKLIKTKLGTRVECKCLFKNCGNIFTCRLDGIRTGRIKSCGCYNAFKASKTNMNNHNWKGHQELSLTYFNSIKFNALNRNKKGRFIEFDITIEQIWQLFLKQDKKCALTGIPITLRTKVRAFDGTASLDRIDSSKGYIEGNVQWIHKDIQDSKFDKSDKEFIKLCCLVADYKRNCNIND